MAMKKLTPQQKAAMQAGGARARAAKRSAQADSFGMRAANALGELPPLLRGLVQGARDSNIYGLSLACARMAQVEEHEATKGMLSLGATPAQFEAAARYYSALMRSRSERRDAEDQERKAADLAARVAKSAPKPGGDDAA